MRLTAKIKRPDKEDLIVYTKGTYEDTIPAEMTKNDIRAILKKLADYEDTEEQGLLLRLPCKVGDIVYKVNKASKKISKHRVLKIEIEKMEGTDFTTQIWFENYDFTFAHRFGEVIFFTRDEAEAKLKKNGGGKRCIVMEDVSI